MTPTIQYASFLIRLWRETTVACDVSRDWHSQVEHVQTGERWTFQTLDELLEFLRQEVDNMENLKTVLEEV